MRWMFLLSALVVALPGIAAAAAPEVRAARERVVLGQDTTVELEVQVPPGSGPVRAAASSGSFAQPVVEEGPLRKFQWTPPDVRYPLTAVLIFWVDAPEKPPEVAVVRLPLLGRTTLPVTTDPNAQVVIEIGDSQFGPVKADRRGKVQVPIEVPPGVKEARVLATRGELQTQRQIKLDVPNHRPLVAALTPDPLPRSGGWLVVAGEEGLSAESLALTAEGALAEPQPGTPPRYRVSPKEGAQAVSVEVRRRDGKDTARAQAALPIIVEPPPPVVVAPPVAAPAAPTPPRLALHLLAGGFFAGGANLGPAVALGASYTLSPWQGRLAAELEVGLRRAALDAQIEGFGTLHSRVLAGPMLAAARFTLLERSALSLYARAGAGILPFQHDVSSDFQVAFGESKLSPMGFVAVQGAWHFNRFSLLMEVRGEYGPAQTPRLNAQLGGAGLSLGARYRP
jgi:hypothetical protein